MARKIACPAILESVRAVWLACVTKFRIWCEHSCCKYTETRTFAPRTVGVKRRHSGWAGGFVAS
ncbi:hypothetical protein E2C01_054385 [Portunus trituberculatus]|uniref:Uncharacterized protein n=1 Tax=Portunus trituberculatus TaxID=210409 RepID=A0A5B7GRW2_PORTR|nr:hypothetical protein [Portunus trituberculatus]